MQKRFWIVAYPDLTKPVGGIKQLHRVSELISSSGHLCHLIQEDETFVPFWFSSNALTVSKDAFFNNISLHPDKDVIILPETYVPVAHSIVDKDIPRIIFNQNASYTFGMDLDRYYKPSIISSLYNLSSVKQVWSVSLHDCHFLRRAFSLPAQKVRLITNAIDVTRLPEIVSKKRQIVYMPRKNSVDSSIVMNLLKDSELADSWSAKPIVDLSHVQVLKLMQESLLFFSFGFPEGFGLPVAEAMACGCAVIGYDGLGGRELFKHASQFPGLSYPIAYKDWYAFIDALRVFDQNLKQFESEILHDLNRLSSIIRSHYSIDSMRHDVCSAIKFFD